MSVVAVDRCALCVVGWCNLLLMVVFVDDSRLLVCVVVSCRCLPFVVHCLWVFVVDACCLSCVVCCSLCGAGYCRAVRVVVCCFQLLLMCQLFGIAVVVLFVVVCCLILLLLVVC